MNYKAQFPLSPRDSLEAPESLLFQHSMTLMIMLEHDSIIKCFPRRALDQTSMCRSRGVAGRKEVVHHIFIPTATLCSWSRTKKKFQMPSYVRDWSNTWMSRADAKLSLRHECASFALELERKSMISDSFRVWRPHYGVEWHEPPRAGFLSKNYPITEIDKKPNFRPHFVDLCPRVMMRTKKNRKLNAPECA